MTEDEGDILTLIEAIEVGEADKVAFPRPVMDYLGVKPGHPVKVEKGLGDYVTVKPRDDAKWNCPLCDYTNGGHRKNCEKCNCLHPEER